MLELVATVCSILATQPCHDISLTFEAEQASVFECMTYGQVALAAWQAEHPNYSFRRWRCGVAGAVAKL